MNNIKRVPLYEKELVVNFLNENWGSVHPLVNNRELFNYYYVDGDMTNFYVWQENGEVLAVCGYIKCSEEEKSDIWISIWCRKKGANGVGLQLMGAMKELTGARVMSCNNIRPNTMVFYTFLGYHPDKLDHYYRLADLPNYKMTVVNNKIIPRCEKKPEVWLEKLADINRVKAVFEIPHGLKPQKDYWYINKRYFNYPHYKYDVYGVHDGGSVPCLVVFRVNESDEGKVLRLVDYIGKPEDFVLLNGFIDDLIAECGREYCDMYSFGVKGEDAGFVKRHGDENIIPNYLNPLLQKNIDYYFFTTDRQGFTMFKADGDQDRKNLG